MYIYFLPLISWIYLHVTKTVDIPVTFPNLLLALKMICFPQSLRVNGRVLNSNRYSFVASSIKMEQEKCWNTLFSLNFHLTSGLGCPHISCVTVNGWPSAIIKLGAWPLTHRLGLPVIKKKKRFIERY